MASNPYMDGAFVQTGDPTTVSESSPFAPGQLGKILRVANSTLFDPGVIPRIYQYVFRSASDATTPAVGQIAYVKAYDSLSVSADVSDTLGYFHVIGVFPSASFAVGTYGFIQVGGVGPCLIKGSPTSAGDTSGKPIVAENADEAADIVADYNDAAGPLIGKCLTAKNAGSIGTNVVEALLCPVRVGW